MTTRQLFYAELTTSKDYPDKLAFLLHPEETDFTYTDTCLAEFWKQADAGLTGRTEEFIYAHATVLSALWSVWAQRSAGLFGAVLPSEAVQTEDRFDLSISVGACTFEGTPRERTRAYLLNVSTALYERETSIVEHMQEQYPNHRCVKVVHQAHNLTAYRDNQRRGCISFSQNMSVVVLVTG